MSAVNVEREGPRPSSLHPLSSPPGGWAPASYLAPSHHVRPSQRGSGSAVPFPHIGVVFVYSGCSTVHGVNELFAFIVDQKRWVQIEIEPSTSHLPSLPLKQRTSHTTVRSPHTSHLIAFGGWDGGQNLNDIAVIDVSQPVHYFKYGGEEGHDSKGEASSGIHTSASPPSLGGRGAPTSHLPEYDNDSGSGEVRSGSVEEVERTSNSDLTMPTSHTHTRLTASSFCPPTRGTTPSARRGHTTVVYEDRLYLFGGSDGDRNFGDLHSISLAPLWEEEGERGTGPLPRHRQGRGRDNEGGGGGRWEWTVEATTGTAPAGRRGHSAVMWGSKMIIYGGQDGMNFLNDLFVCDLSIQQWTAVNFDGNAPPPRSYHIAQLHNDKVYIYGGAGQNWYFFNDIHVFDLKMRRFSPLQVDGASPSARCFHSGAVLDNDLFVFGGARLEGGRWEYSSDVYRLALTSEDDEVETAVRNRKHSFFKNEEFSDVVIDVDGHSIPAHRVILASASPYFRALFTSGMKEVEESTIKLEEVGKDAFDCALQYMYNGCIPPKSENVSNIELLHIANYLGLKQLEDIMQKEIGKTLSADSVAGVLEAADRLSLLTLKEVCFDYILRHYASVITTSTYLQLCRNEELAKELNKAVARHLTFSFR
eukprot:CAMPEP_0113875200 /NCGR_PEP_ID=MMETSP0780_2-20120614/4800_1 /TAXON_ID=652834 /ORGANISM="Palpitomonas bilix" /LENGTH=645 /DNA_ID=CAMNT_0000861143 /DNA_START=98 /DNA_END=2035 /DNA_ORIENTATION=+ /assembly_acc=CAM_ASM_000599